MPSNNAKIADSTLKKIDQQVRKRDGMAGIFNHSSVVAYVNCCECLKPRAVFSIKSTADDREALCQYIEHAPWQCGEALVRHHIQLGTTHFVRQELLCGSKVQDALYSRIVRAKLSDCQTWCIHCGTSEDVEVALDRTEDGRAVRPQCTACTAADRPVVPFGMKRTAAALAAESQKRGRANASNHATPSPTASTHHEVVEHEMSASATPSATLDFENSCANVGLGDMDDTMADILSEMGSGLRASAPFYSPQRSHMCTASADQATSSTDVPTLDTHTTSSTSAGIHKLLDVHYCIRAILIDCCDVLGNLEEFINQEQARGRRQDAVSHAQANTSGGQRWQGIMAQEPSGAGDVQRIADAAASGHALERGSRQRRPPPSRD
jgi:hypothetical protein